jgi:protein-tyrosine phosphatase
MHEISPFPLWIGHAGDGRDNVQLSEFGVEAVVQLAIEEPPLDPLREMVYCRVPLLDGVGNPPGRLLLAVRTVTELIRGNVQTLVCCGNGLSRSPVIAAAALALIHREPPDDWLRRVVALNPSDVSPGFWDEVVALFPEWAEATSRAV